MNAKKFHYILIGSLVFLVLATGAVIYLANGLMQKTSDSLVAVKLDILGLDQQEKTYIQARKDIEKYSAVSDTVEKVLPEDKDQARAVRELYQIAGETSINIESIQFPSSTLGQKIAKTPEAASSAQISISQAKPVEGMSGVLGIDMEVRLLSSRGSSSSISYDNLNLFLQKVEKNRRSMMIKKISVSPDLKEVNLTVTIFVKP
jgi:hypothetical protein